MENVVDRREERLQRLEAQRSKMVERGQRGDRGKDVVSVDRHRPRDDEGTGCDEHPASMTVLARCQIERNGAHLLLPLFPEPLPNEPPQLRQTLGVAPGKDVDQRRAHGIRPQG